MNTLRIKQLLTFWLVLSLMQSQAQTNKTKDQNTQKQSTTITEKVNNINGSMPNRISMNVTVPKQTQGATFGEKVNAGLAIAKMTPEQEATLRGVITGSVTWNSEPFENGTNTDAVSSVGNLAGGAGGGAAAASYARSLANKAGVNGVVSLIYARVSPIAGITAGVVAGRQQYQPVFFEGQENVCTDCVAKVTTNPYFVQNEMAGEMTSLEKSKSVEGIDDDCDGVEGLTVSLVNEQTGVVVASVKTERCGDFYFENLLKAPYVLKFGGEFISKKSYDIAFDKEGTFDVTGELLSANNKWTIKINTGLTEKPNDGEKVNAGLHAAGGAISQGASLLGGALPGGAVISAAVSSYSPGDPIPGLDIKFMEASTNSAFTSKTNEKGQFEFTGLSDTNYTLSSIIHFYIDGSIPVSLWFSKKGYDYYKAQSDMNKTTDEPPIKEIEENKQKNNENAKGKKGLNAVNVKTSKTKSEKINPAAITKATASLQDLKKSLADLEKLLNEDKRQYSITKPQINNVRNRIDELEIKVKNLGLLGKTAAAISDLDAKLNLMNTDASVLLENLGQLGNDYSSISNVLKTKHDTAKNSVGNIR
jgi:hypothetical protein